MSHDDIASPATALYSVMMGSYEQLNEQLEIAERVEDDVRRILLTDNPELRSAFWEVVVVEPAFAGDPVRSQRLLKILGHPVLDSFDRTLYIDNAVTLRTPPGALLDRWLADAPMALPEHSYRTHLVDEFDEILRLQYDDPSRVYEQLLHYAEHHRDALETRPLWTAILARRRDQAVSAAMRTWADHVLRYSRRDQLSVAVALKGLSSVHRIALDNMASEDHVWPTELGRNIAQGKAFEPASGPLLAELRRRDARVEEADQARADAEARAVEAERLRDELGNAGEVLRQDALAAQAGQRSAEERVAKLEAALTHARAAAEQAKTDASTTAAAEVRSTYEESLSWRITAPLRALRRPLRR